MPHGQLFLRTRKTITALSGTNADGFVTIDGQTGWVDAHDRYGMSLEDGAVSKIMTPAPNKQPTGNSNVLTHGVALLQDTIGVKDARTFSADFHITAASQAQFLARYSLLCSEVFDGGYIQLRTSFQKDTVYHLNYEGCSEYESFRLEMAKYTLSLTEPHPEIRIMLNPNILL